MDDSCVAPSVNADVGFATKLNSVRLIDASTCRSIVRVSLSTWKRLVARGVMPPPIKIGACSRWNEDEVVAAIRRLADLRK